MYNLLSNKNYIYNFITDLIQYKGLYNYLYYLQ